ncbi:armadillo repeat-containing protein 2 isoform X2 [Nelusetta ayraudi]|uniref:armadillo repeat-containing protein 2 isoform X2 n=1 Tax=Nelusetta ayraudi TaxID=303726 RepID=UPI003F701BF5
MSSQTVKQRKCTTKTSAEIVSEARQSLRVQSTKRPFTPRDGHRHLFGEDTVRASHGNRPPSSFSLHAQNFDAPDSRPGSGTRLSPLEHPKLPEPCDTNSPFKAFPKPPTDPLEVKSRLAVSRGRFLRVETLVDGDAKEKLNPGHSQKQPSAKKVPGKDRTEVHIPRKPEQRGTASESTTMSSRFTDAQGAAAVAATSGTIQPGDDSADRPADRGSGQKTELERRGEAKSKEDVEAVAWKNRIAPLLQELESVAAGSSEGSVERLCELCEGLHRALARADLLGRSCKRRAAILRTLFRLVDLNSARLDLCIARLCLALRVSGNNLLNICKLVFQMSRNERNDGLFQENSIIETLLSVLTAEESEEALLYCVGALKFLSGNGAILRLLLDNNCMSVAQRLMGRLCSAEDARSAMAGHILVQLTTLLRNLADLPDSRPLFVSFSILPELCRVLRHHSDDQDICTNISRIYSKLSSYSECRHALARTPDCYRLFLELLNKHHQKQDLVVRLLFTLGNLTAKMDEARQQLFQCEGCTLTLLRLYDAYQRRRDPPLAAPAEADDVLVKLVRVLANMCIHRAVGPALASDHGCIQLLIETLELRSVQESEELMVNVAAALNNLSFYQAESAALRSSQLAIARLMLKLVFSSSMDTILEAVRVYGNLSQSKDVRDLIMEQKVHRFVVTLLDSKSSEMCFSACGVLTNLAMEPPNRARLELEGAAAKLVDCLKDLGAGDWQLAGQLCQALWNMIGTGTGNQLDTPDKEALLEILIIYLDEEEALDWIENEDMKDYHRACWELEFLPVAQKLLGTLQPLNA